MKEGQVSWHTPEREKCAHEMGELTFPFSRPHKQQFAYLFFSSSYDAGKAISCNVSSCPLHWAQKTVDNPLLFCINRKCFFFVFRLKTCGQLSREKHAWRWGQNQLLLMMPIVSFLHSSYVWFSMCYLFPQQLSVNNFKEQIRSYGRGSPTHSDQPDSQQCKGDTTLLIRIDKVAIQNWQWLRYRVGKLAIQYCKVAIQYWKGYDTFLARLLGRNRNRATEDSVSS